MCVDVVEIVAALLVVVVVVDLLVIVGSGSKEMKMELLSAYCVVGSINVVAVRQRGHFVGRVADFVAV